MIHTAEQFAEYINKSTISNDIIDFSVEDFVDHPFDYIKRFLLEMKVQIDRWDLVMEYLYVHPYNAAFLINYLGKYVNEPDDTYKSPNIWGVEIIQTDKIPPTILLGTCESVDLEDIVESEARHLVMAKLDFKLVERLNKIKAFW